MGNRGVLVKQEMIYLFEREFYRKNTEIMVKHLRKGYVRVGWYPRGKEGKVVDDFRKAWPKEKICIF